MGIYEETYEKIAYRVKQGNEKKNKTVIPEGVDEDDALVNIFAKPRCHIITESH